MYRILTGICCAVWCAAITLQVFGLNKASQNLDTAEYFTEYFTEEFTEDVSAQIRLSGSCPALSSETEITRYLEGAAAVMGIQSGYGIVKKQEVYGCVWELTGANPEFNCSLKYLSREDGDSLISWSISGNWSENMQKIYDQKEKLEEYSQTSSAVCLEIQGTWQQRLTPDEMDASAKRLMEKAKATLVNVQRQGNLQLYYGYGENFGEGIRFLSEEANINLMYRVSDTQTKCTLGFPAVQWDY